MNADVLTGSADGIRLLEEPAQRQINDGRNLAIHESSVVMREYR